MTADILETFSRRLYLLRVTSRLTQAELAAKAARSRSSIANMEAGRQIPGVLELAVLAEALDCTIGVLVGEVEDPRIDAAEAADRKLLDIDAEVARLMAERRALADELRADGNTRRGSTRGGATR